MTDDLKKSNSKGDLLIPIILGVIIVILLFLGCTFYFLSNSTSRIVSKVVNSLYDDYKSKSDSMIQFDFESNPYVIDGDIVIDTNISGLEELKNDKLKFRMGLDYENEKLLSSFSFIEYSNPLVSLVYYYVDSNCYVKIDDYDKLVKTQDEFSFDEIFNSDSSKKEDLDYVIYEFKNIFLDSLDNNSFKKSSDTIEINGKKESVSKLSYRLSEENVKNLNENISKGILSNDKLLEKLSNLTQKDIEHLKNILGSIDNMTYEDSGEISFYVQSSNKLRMIEYSNDDTVMSAIFDDGIEKVSVKNGLYETDFTINSFNKEVIDIDYVINYGTPISGSILLTNEEIGEDKFQYSTDFSINLLTYSLSVKGNYVIESVDNIFDLDTSNYVDIENLDVNELNTIMENISDKIKNSNLVKILNNFAGGMNSMM